MESLERLSLAQLKVLAAERGIKNPVGHKGYRATWIAAILSEDGDESDDDSDDGDTVDGLAEGIRHLAAGDSNDDTTCSAIKRDGARCENPVKAHGRCGLRAHAAGGGGGGRGRHPGPAPLPRPGPDVPPPPSAKLRALCIGLANYTWQPKLTNPVNDALAVAGALKSAGFVVSHGHDLKRAALRSVVKDFIATVKPGDTVVVFLSGHGLEIEGSTRLLPVDNNEDDQGEPSAGLGIDVSVVNALDAMKPRLSLVLLDACRSKTKAANKDSAGGRGPGTGMLPKSGMVIGYATSPNKVAKDSCESCKDSSPYAAALVKHLTKPDDIMLVMFDVSAETEKLTGGKQVPWEHTCRMRRGVRLVPK